MRNKRCDCNEELGYTYTPSGTSWCQNDSLGMGMFCLLLSIIVLVSYTICNVSYMMVTTCVALILLFIIALIIRPILFLYMFSALICYHVSTPEFMDRTTMFPNYKRFERPHAYQRIRDEVNTFLGHTNGGNELFLFADTYGGENRLLGNFAKKNNKTLAWRVMNIKLGNEYSEEARIHFPYMVSILQRTPEIVSCMISVLEPGVKIPIHNGYYKGIMRYMLPTHVPKDREKVFLCVNGVKYHWTEGEGVLWDDTYAHKVYNQSDESRVIFFMDVVRPIVPDKSSWLDMMNRIVIDLVSGSSFIKEEVARTEKKVNI